MAVFDPPRPRRGMMRDIVGSIEGEYRRYRKLGLETIRQCTDAELTRQLSPESNSLAALVWHLGGNLESRFTDFLTTDGEKAWRHREDEFAARTATRAEVEAKWEQGWEVVLGSLAALSDQDLQRTVTIRGVEHSVAEALHRSVAHTAYHVGQMTFIGKALRGASWTYLSIAPGGTAAYNANPDREKG
jgi:uncharacterized damage-inducible protein DinB